jgi:hypothetical protein
MADDVEYLSKDQILALKDKESVMKKLSNISSDDYQSAFFTDDKKENASAPMKWEEFLEAKLEQTLGVNKKLEAQKQEFEDKQKEVSKDKAHNKGAHKSFLFDSLNEKDFLSQKLGLTDRKQNTTEHNAENKGRLEKTEFYHAAKLAEAGIIIAPSIIGGSMKFIGKKLQDNGYEDAAKVFEKSGDFIMKGGEYTANIAHNTLMVVNYIMQPPTDNVLDLFANLIKASLPVKSNGKEVDEKEKEDITTPLDPNSTPDGPKSGNPNNSQDLPPPPPPQPETAVNKDGVAQTSAVVVEVNTNQTKVVAEPEQAKTQGPVLEQVNLTPKQPVTQPQVTVFGVEAVGGNGNKTEKSQTLSGPSTNPAKTTADFVANAKQENFNPNIPVTPSAKTISQGQGQVKQQDVQKNM